MQKMDEKFNERIRVQEEKADAMRTKMAAAETKILEKVKDPPKKGKKIEVDSIIVNFFYRDDLIQESKNLSFSTTLTLEFWGDVKKIS